MEYRVRFGQYRGGDTRLCQGTVAIIAVHLTFRILKSRSFVLKVTLELKARHISSRLLG